MAAEPTEPAPADAAFDRWRWWKRWFGRRGERAAARYLRTLGYRILAANVSDALGELDLLALDGETLVVVEVRSTGSDRPDAIEQTAASVDARKQQRVCRAATRFLAARRLLGKIALRYDVLVVAWPDGQPEPAVKHIPHAFESTGRYQFFT